MDANHPYLLDCTNEVDHVDHDDGNDMDPIDIQPSILVYSLSIICNNSIIYAFVNNISISDRILDIEDHPNVLETNQLYEANGVA